jgi:hypothetical protein
MKKWFQRKLELHYSQYKWYRKWVGGYWELWYIDILSHDIWFKIDKDIVYNGIINNNHTYRPGCGHGSPYCEYYPIQFFNYKNILNKDILKILERQIKLKNILNEKSS